MKKKVIRLNENDIENLVKKVIKEEDYVGAPGGDFDGITEDRFNEVKEEALAEFDMISEEILNRVRNGLKVYRDGLAKAEYVDEMKNYSEDNIDEVPYRNHDLVDTADAYLEFLGIIEDVGFSYENISEYVIHAIKD